MQTLWATLETARQTLLQLLRHRLLWLLSAGLLGMPLLLWAVARAGHLPREMHAARAVVLVATLFHVYALLPWTAMFFGVQAVHGDLEDRTFQYLFLRPVRRGAVLLGKWLAAFLLTLLVMVAGLLLLLWLVRATALPWPDELGPARLFWCYAAAHACGAAAYAAVAVLLAARFRRPMVWSAGYIVGFDAVIASLPPEAGVRSLAVVDALRRQLIEGLEVSGRLLHLLWPNSQWRHDFIGHPQRQLLWITGLCVLLAMLVYSRSEYDSRPRE